MALYEITFLTKEEADPGVKAAIEEAGGTIQNESSMGRRRLAYPINKETQAVYTTFVFDADSKVIAGIDRKLRLNANVMRHLIVTKRIVQPSKEVSKTVREAIEAAEKLEDTVADTSAPVVMPEPVEEVAPVEEAVVAEAPAEEVAEVAPDAAPAEETAEEVKEEKPKRAAKKTVKADANAAEATEEDRLKALEDKLSDILKD